MKICFVAWFVVGRHENYCKFSKILVLIFFWTACLYSKQNKMFCTRSSRNAYDVQSWARLATWITHFLIFWLFVLSLYCTYTLTRNEINVIWYLTLQLSQIEIAPRTFKWSLRKFSGQVTIVFCVIHFATAVGVRVHEMIILFIK